MDTVLAQFFATPIPEPVSLGVVLVGLAVLWFRNSQIVTRKATVAATRRNTLR